ncbi:MAG: geranylgeranyl reductase family protein [Anaerolineae bacterium]|nr:geranylgeranyl reductase family protein [Anaerolineae bacterium]
MYDSIIVGAGPAGSFLAFLLAQNGFRTLLLDKAVLPRYKTCGGGLPYKTIRSIPFDLQPVLEVEAKGGRVAYQGRTALKVDFEKPYGWLVMRDRFDAFLVERAVAAGAELATDTRLVSLRQSDHQVTAETTRGSFSAQTLIGADGVNSLTARALDLLPDRLAGAALEAEVEVPQSALLEQGPYVTFDFGALPKGYGWIFPKRDHLSVGVFQAAPGKVVDIRRRLEQYMEWNPLLRKRKIARLHGHLIPLGDIPGELHRGRVLLVGDAANLADAWIGEGIYYALQSARIASEVIAEALSGGCMDLSTYSQRVQHLIGKQLAAARGFARLVYWRPKTATKLLSRSRRLQGLLFSAIRGDLSLQKFSRQFWLQSPLIILEALSKPESWE